VYLLHAGDETREVTYIGCTYDVDRRLRQHNCEVAGGAKNFTTRWTKKGLLWKVACTVQVPSLTAARILERQWKKQANVVNSRASQKQLALVERKRVALDEEVRCVEQASGDVGRGIKNACCTGEGA